MDADGLSLKQHETPAVIHTQPLFTMRLEVQPIVKIGATPAGIRRVGVVTGGRIDGDRLRGKVLPGANDWQHWRSDGSLLLDVRLAFETDSGALVAMTYRGVRHGPSEVITRLERGESVDPASYYFRIAPMFETADTGLNWLNHVVAIGTGYRAPDGPIYHVFEVL